MTLKNKINEFLKETDYTHFYGRGSSNSFPYVRYTLGDNFTKRLSNKKGPRNIWYQLDVFNNRPFDVQGSEMLTTIEEGLEERDLFTTDWIEAIDDDNTTTYPIYHYFIEVRE